MTLFTIGHSTRPLEQFLVLLRQHGVEQLIDVRTAAGSRRNPQYMKEQLSASLVERGIRYLHMKELGGFRKPLPDSPNAAWRNDSFRGYADYMATPEFQEALVQLIGLAAGMPTVIMCAEAVPWRCHRSLIADALLVRGIEVRHIMSATKTDIHALRPFAVVEGELVRYPETLTPQPPLPPAGEGEFSRGTPHGPPSVAGEGESL